ncbi:MAG: metallophosphoesterase [Actinomycetota bacterium]|nr:metallophosphoesterase [Actinomycetota bacterium]
MVVWILAVVLAAAVVVLAWGWFEAGWVRKRVLEIEVGGVPAELDGLRIAHLSDLHLGTPSRGRRAVQEAVAWVADRRPDLVCVTGDLLSRRGGVPELERLLRELGPCLVVLGNHDFADSRDRFSQRVDPDVFAALEGVIVLGDEAVELELRGQRVQIVGVAPGTYALRRAQPHLLVDRDAPLRILLCHFPGIARRIPPGSFELILAGHYHAGQIVVPFPGGGLNLAHPRIRDVQGVHRYGSTSLHVSPGLGTTFVPLRFFARPEVTELVVRSS